MGGEAAGHCGAKRAAGSWRWRVREVGAERKLQVLSPEHTGAECVAAGFTACREALAQAGDRCRTDRCTRRS